MQDGTSNHRGHDAPTGPDFEGCWTLEKVSGPHHGHYLAGYARAVHDGFLAYVKIFDHEPATVWDSAAIAKVSSGATRSHTAALMSAEARALAWLSGDRFPRLSH